MLSLAIGDARRMAVACQGFGQRSDSGGVDRRRLRQLVHRLGAIQIDSVNVVVRSHYLPVFSRLGPYDSALLDDAAYRRRELFEYWGHEASLLPVSFHPLLRWRMERARAGHAWRGLVQFARERPQYVEAVRREVERRGPLSAGQLSDPGARRGPWWGWADGKRALEWLYWVGDLAIADRRRFERVYDLPERVLPPEVLATPTPTAESAHRELLLHAARALGIGTARDLADYFRIPVPEARTRIHELVEARQLTPATVEGWRDAAYLPTRIVRVTRGNARALLSPFDSLLWERTRVQRLFGFHLRLELYTPAPLRRFGYYVMPFLLGDALVARVDLKADRASGALLVHGAYLENDGIGANVTGALADELRRLAHWLGLPRVRVGARGNLARLLRRALPSPARPASPR